MNCEGSSNTKGYPVESMHFKACVSVIKRDAATLILNKKNTKKIKFCFAIKVYRKLLKLENDNCACLN